MVAAAAARLEAEETGSLEKMRDEREARIEGLMGKRSDLVHLLSMEKKNDFRFLRRCRFVWFLGNFNIKFLGF